MLRERTRRGFRILRLTRAPMGVVCEIYRCLDCLHSSRVAFRPQIMASERVTPAKFLSVFLNLQRFHEGMSLFLIGAV